MPLDVHVRCDEQDKLLKSSDKSVSLASDLIEFTIYLGRTGDDQSGEPVIAGCDHGKEFRLSLDITFKTNVNGDELLFGNDFDKPIRDILPYGFSWALALFKRLIDPSVDGDVYSDQPYLYGFALTSFNHLYKRDGDNWNCLDIPNESTRQSKYMNPDARKEFNFEKGDRYYMVFSTPYLEVSDERQAVLLPGFSFDVSNITCDQPLRYTLKLQNGPRLLSIEFHKT